MRISVKCIIMHTTTLNEKENYSSLHCIDFYSLLSVRELVVARDRVKTSIEEGSPYSMLQDQFIIVYD